MGTAAAAPSTLANVTDLIKLFYPSGGATTSSNNTQTTNNSSSVSQDKIDAIIKGVLESNSGMTSIANMQKSAGLRDSSTNLLLQNDLIARAAAEGAKLQTNTTSTTSNSAAGKTTPTASLSPGTAVGAVAGLQALSPILKGMNTEGAKKFGNNIYDSVFGKTPANSGATPSTMSGSSDISVSDIMGSGDANAAADAAANAARDAVGPSIDYSGTAGLPDAIGNAVGDSSSIADAASAADGISGAYDAAAGFSDAAEAAAAASAASDAASAAVDTSGSIDWSDAGDFFGGFFGDGGRVPTKESMLDKARNLFAGKARVKQIDKVDAAETGADSNPAADTKKEEEPPKPFRFADGGRVPRIGARSLATGGANTIDRTNALNELGIGVGDAGTDNRAASMAEYRKAQGGNPLYSDPSVPAGTRASQDPGNNNVNPDTAAAINAVGSFFGPVGSLITHGAIGTANSGAVQDQVDSKNSLAEASIDGNAGGMLSAQDDSTRAHLDATGAAIGGAADGVVDTVGSVGTAADSVMAGVGNIADKVFSALGFADGGSVPAGKVPGHDLNGTDNVHVMLTGGEEIIPTDVVDILGQDFFDGLIKKFHKPVQQKGK